MPLAHRKRPLKILKYEGSTGRYEESDEEKEMDSAKESFAKSADTEYSTKTPDVEFKDKTEESSDKTEESK